MSFDLKTLQEQRNSLLVQLQSIATHKDGWSADRRSKFDRIDREVQTLEADIQRAQTLDTYDKANSQFTRSPRPGVGDGSDVRGVVSKDERRSMINRAFQIYALDGRAALNEEQRTLLTTSDVTGGAFIPQEFSGILVDALKYAGPVVTKVRQKITNNSGVPMKISLDDDTANGIVLLGTEGTSAPAETDPTLLSRILNVDTVTGGLVKVSFQELEDSSFDLASFLSEKFGKRYARGVESAVTLGKDSAGTVLPNSATGGLVGIATSAETTATLAAGIGWTDLTTLFGTLDPAYLVDPNWVMNSNTRSYLIGLKDGFGRPYFQNDPSGTAPFTKIMGYDIVLDQAMPSVAVNATPILFGSLNDSLLWRTDGAPSLLRLNERFADQLLVGFYLYSRVGSISLKAGSASPIVKLTIAAS